MRLRPAVVPAALAAAVAFAVATSCSKPAAPTAAPTPEAARAFIEKAEERLLDLANRQQRAAWVQATYITDDTEKIASEANKDFTAATMELAKEATRFDGLKLPDDVARRLLLLKLSLPLPAPSDPKLQTELAQTAVWLESTYGKGKYTPPGKPTQDIGALSRTLATSRKPEELLDAWKGWHAISPPMRPEVRALRHPRAIRGRATSASRTSGLCGAPTTTCLPTPSRRTWSASGSRCSPFYESLHTYVRSRLVEKYGTKVVPADGPIPAHLLGNMWAQEWGNIYDIAAPPAGDPGFDLSQLLKAKKVDEVGLVKYGERFFTSLGFEPLPETFWTRSLFTKPQDREVVCHASAWDVDNDQDLRIKMCIEVGAEDFVVVHHELGHNFYQRAYRKQPFLFRNGANDGFHEAIGDAIALSVTPEYLVKVGLLGQGAGGQGRPRPPDAHGPRQGGLPSVWSADRPVARQGLLRRDHASQLQRRLVGAAPQATRAWRRPSSAPRPTSTPGAKYHVPANVPYTRYFLAHVLQFQLHRALCREAGQTGPLHTCSIYDSKAAGSQAPEDAGDGTEPTVARGARGRHGREADRRRGHARVLRSPAGVARRAEQGQEDRVAVSRSPESDSVSPSSMHGLAR